MSRVLVLASSIIPLPGLPTNGGGLRGWTLARGLEAAGHDVTVLFPRNSLDEQRAEIAAEARAAALPHTFEWSAPLAAIEERRPDVVVACSWLLAGQLPSCPAGLALAWQDPVAPLEATLATVERRGRGRLAIYADAHPVHSRGAAWFAWLQDRVRGHDRATLHGLVPYDALLAVYRGADLALDL